MAKIDERYKRGQIYTIRCRYDDDMIYVGSTINTLAKRMGKHRNTSVKRATSLYHIVCGDWNNWYIELHENYSCNNKQELEKREGQVIREIATINKCIAGRTCKEYYQDNREKIAEKSKEYYQDNREKIAEKDKKYYENNRDKIAEKAKEYRQNNRDELLEKKKEYGSKKVKCEICGCECRKDNLKQHQKSKKCMNYNVTNN